MKVVGLTGTIGAGKEFAKEFLEKNFNATSVTLSSLLKEDVLRKRGMKITREVKQNLGDDLRKQYGNEVLVKIAVGFMPRNKDLLIIDGIRNFGESEFLKKTFGDNYKLIGIDAPKQIRFERIQNNNRDYDPKTFEEFVKTDERDRGINQPEYGQQVEKCLKIADVIVQNDGNLEELRAKLQEVLKILE